MGQEDCLEWRLPWVTEREPVSEYKEGRKEGNGVRRESKRREFEYLPSVKMVLELSVHPLLVSSLHLSVSPHVSRYLHCPNIHRGSMPFPKQVV